MKSSIPPKCRALRSKNRVLLQISRAVQEMKSSKNLEKILKSLCAQLRDVGLDFQVLGLHRLIDDEGALFESLEVQFGKDVRRLRRPLPNVYRMWQGGETVYRPDVEADPGGLSPGGLEAIRRRTGVPVRCILDVVSHKGTLALASARRDAFSASEIKFVEEVGDLLSLGLTRIEDLENLEEANRRLRESEERFRLLAENARDIVFRYRLGPNEGFEYISPSCEGILGCAPADVYTDTGRILGRIHPYDRANLETLLRRKRGWKQSLVLRWRHPDGETVWLEMHGVPIWDQAKNIVAVEGIARDITARKQAETVREGERKIIQSLLDGLPLGICLMDTDRRILLANQAFTEYLDTLSGAGAVDRPLSNLGTHPMEEVLNLVDSGVKLDVETGAQEGQIFEVAAHRLDSQEESLYMLILEDVTWQRQDRMQIEQQNRLAAVGQLAAGIAHDFNNILTTMMGTAQILEMQEGFSEQVRKNLKTIYEQGERAAHLTRQILDFSRKTVVENQPMDLVPFMKEMVKLLQRTLPETIQVIFEYEDNGHIAMANPTQLQQVVMNLSSNAQDAMHDGGELRLSLSGLTLEAQDEPPVRGLKPGKWSVLTLADEGTGMSDGVLQHVFEPFFTTKAPGKGTGLGLAQVHGIVKQLGGEIVVESQEHKGTTFRIYLPQVGRTEAAEEARVDATQEALRGNQTILVVEDERTVQKVVARFLENLGYRVLTADDGEEAMAVYRAEDGGVDLVLSDMVMPNMNGYELVEALRNLKNPDIRLVMMTGYPLRSEKGKDFYKKIDGCLTKPLNLKQLARVVKEALRENRDLNQYA